MARFRGTINGGRGEVSRLGHSEFVARANGWNGGVCVALKRGLDSNDEAKIWIGPGSAGKGDWILIYDGSIGPATRTVLASGKWVGTELKTKIHREEARD